jgi:hypothetical protein
MHAPHAGSAGLAAARRTIVFVSKKQRELFVELVGPLLGEWGIAGRGCGVSALREGRNGSRVSPTHLVPRTPHAFFTQLEKCNPQLVCRQLDGSLGSSKPAGATPLSPTSVKSGSDKAGAGGGPGTAPAALPASRIAMLDALSAEKFFCMEENGWGFAGVWSGPGPAIVV